MQSGGRNIETLVLQQFQDALDCAQEHIAVAACEAAVFDEVFASHKETILRLQALWKPEKLKPPQQPYF